MARISSPEPLERLGVASICALLGVVVGAIVCMVLLALHRSFSMPLVVPSVAGLLAIVGFAAPRAAMNCAEAAVHFAVGVLTFRRSPQPDSSAPTWLKVALGAGLLAGLAFYALLSS